MTVDALSRAVTDFLAESRDVVVVEAGEVIFDFATARYSVSEDHGRCLLHLWSEERNVVRRVLDAERRDGTLRLTVLRFGQSRPTRLEMCRGRDRRTATAQRSARAAYERQLRRVLERAFPGYDVIRLTSAPDLERSFGPVYARGLLKRGQSAWAVLGVNGEEPQAAVDGSLTFALLWLDACRRQGLRAVVEGLKVFVPAGRGAIVRQRMARLNPRAAKFELYELNERDAELDAVDCRDGGNLATRLVRSIHDDIVRERFAASIATVLEVAPEAEAVPLSSAEVAFRRYGLEFARARMAPGAGFRNVEEIVFGAGACEARLTGDNREQFAGWVRRVMAERHPGGPRDSPLWRAQPERWLESLVARDVTALDSRFDPAFVYLQVPAFSASNRAKIDVLTITREGRLAVLELKADEDIHLPLQGLDYWARVEWHRARGEFQQYGYFPGREITRQAPLLILVAPALRVHPATDTLLRYIAPEIDWELTGIGERWREELRVIFRKRSGASAPTAEPRPGRDGISSSPKDGRIEPAT